MPKEKYEFYVSTPFINSSVKETIEFEIPDEFNEHEKEDFIQKQFEEWVWENIESSYEIIE